MYDTDTVYEIDELTRTVAALRRDLELQVTLIRELRGILRDRGLLVEAR